MKALIVDDSKPIRSIITRVLTGLEFECFEATNGDEALEVLGRISKPNLVTINWHMPQMDGIELIRRLRSSPLHRNLTLLMISSEQDRSKVETAINIGANDYLSKPFTAAALIRKHDDRKFRMAFPEESQCRESIHHRHFYVQEHDIRRILTNHVEAFLTVNGHSNNPKLQIQRENARQNRTDCSRIVDQHHFNLAAWKGTGGCNILCGAHTQIDRGTECAC